MKKLLVIVLLFTSFSALITFSQESTGFLANVRFVENQNNLPPLEANEIRIQTDVINNGALLQSINIQLSFFRNTSENPRFVNVEEFFTLPLISIEWDVGQPDNFSQLRRESIGDVCAEQLYLESVENSWPIYLSANVTVLGTSEDGSIIYREVASTMIPFDHEARCA